MPTESKNSNLPPEIHLQLEKLKSHERAMRRFIDLELYPKDKILFGLGWAIIRLLRDEEFYSSKEAEATAAMLQYFYTGSFHILSHMERADL